MGVEFRQNKLWPRKAINVGFRSAKARPFAERKATLSVTCCFAVPVGMSPDARNRRRTSCVVPGRWGSTTRTSRITTRNGECPVHDDRKQFEFLVLESAQAGLSWSTVLNKRDGYRRAFADFDPEKVARFTDRRIERLLQDPGIIRNRLKVRAAVRNARAFLQVQEECGTFSQYIWQFVDGQPRPESLVAANRICRRRRKSPTP